MSREDQIGLEDRSDNVELDLSADVNLSQNKFFESRTSRDWAVFGSHISKGFVKYFAQLIILYLLICTSLGMSILSTPEEKTI